MGSRVLIALRYDTFHLRLHRLEHPVQVAEAVWLNGQEVRVSEAVL